MLETLHELTDAQLECKQKLEHALEEGDISEEEYDELIADNVDALSDMISDKLEACQKMIDIWEAEAKAYKDMEDKFKQMKARRLRTSERLKNYMKFCMNKINVDDVTTSIGHIRIVKNGGKRALTMKCSPNKIDPKYVIKETTLKVNTDAVRKLIEISGVEETKWYKLEPQGNHIKVS